MYLNRYQLEILAAVHEEAKACMNLYKITQDASFKKELLLKMKLYQNKIKKIKGEIKKFGRIFYINKNKKEIGLIFNNKLEIVLMEY